MNPMISLEDEQFMYFGWWRRKTTEGAQTGEYNYRMFSASMGQTVAGNLETTLEGSARYVGPAIGQYAVPLGDQLNHGKFSATAEFMANFETEMLSGSVTDFDVSSGWSLTLRETPMTSGTVTQGNVTWYIDGNPRDGGNWDGTFHSELADYGGGRPDGLTGTFDAEHGPSGNPVARLRGAFGTYRQ